MKPAGVNGRVRYAVVGLGHVAQAAILPAFERLRENCELRALVSGDPAKSAELSKRYRVPLIYPYQRFDECLRSGEVDAVYIALPNRMHCEYAVAAAKAGVHVLCEKPMAVTELDCERMMREARQHQVRLMIADRLRFDAAHLEAVKIVASGQLGNPRIFNSVITMQVQDGKVPLNHKLGGGPLWDIGIYCINAARQLFDEEPNEVFAFSGSLEDRRFVNVQESTSAILRFPHGRLAMFTCSFGAARQSVYEIVGTKAILRSEAAYERAHFTTHRLFGNGHKQERVFPQRDQFACEIAAFSECLLKVRDPHVSGEEGLADVRIVQALLHSAETRCPVRLNAPDSSKRRTIAPQMAGLIA